MKRCLYLNGWDSGCGGIKRHWFMTIVHFRMIDLNVFGDVLHWKLKSFAVDFLKKNLFFCTSS